MRDMVARTDPSVRVVHIAELVHQALFRGDGDAPPR
jgi:hypothetical protein